MRPTSPMPTWPAKMGAPRTLGPVADLERHLPQDWWSSLFNSIYLKTDGDVVENDRITRAECDMLEKFGALQLEHRILDVCCGQGRHLLELANRGYSLLTGIDRSRYLVRLARKRAKAGGRAIMFREGDARKLPSSIGPCDRITLLGNSFGYFEKPEDDERVLEGLRRLLKPGGVLILDVTDGAWMRGHFESRSWEWIDSMHFVCRERALSTDGNRLISREVVTHADKGVLVDQFYAERLYDRVQLAELLQRAGFEDIQVHAEIVPDSDRGQDLGLMAHRMLVTACSPEPAAPTLRWSDNRRITVLLGDPRLPDEVKRTGRFSAEDLETVDRLKLALAELSEFKFEYLDDHSSLLDRLASRTPAFVLNLCDEGFSNDPLKELHITALLEMLGTPYSGAGPACLSLCYDKALVRAVAESLEVPVPLETYIRAGDQGVSLPSAFPVLVKPNLGDSSLGITSSAVVHGPDELIAYLRKLSEKLPKRSILVQEFLPGDEYSVGIIGNPGLGFTALPIMEVDYSGLDSDLPRILGYESKWHPDSPYWTEIAFREARLEESLASALIDYSQLLFERLGCRDYARFDFRTDAEGTVKLLEVNPNPGWCWDGKLNLMADMAGWSYSHLLNSILIAARDRVLAGADSSQVEARLAAR